MCNHDERKKYKEQTKILQKISFSKHKIKDKKLIICHKSFLRYKLSLFEIAFFSGNLTEILITLRQLIIHQNSKSSKILLFYYLAEIK